MLKHETRLIDPTPEQVAAACRAAAAAANTGAGVRPVDNSPARWQKLARKVAREPEGWEMTRGGDAPASVVHAGWWTDAPGRKHVAVRGGRVECGWSGLLNRKALAVRPALWHLSPDRLVVRRVRGREQWVCVCGCGAVGTAQTLGWAGDCCGPCSDQREEFGPGALAANTPGLLVAGPQAVLAVMCTPDGGTVAAVDEEPRLYVWNLRTGSRRTLKIATHPRNSRFALTTDGLYLVATGAWFEAKPVAVFDLATDPPTRVEVKDAPAGVLVAPLPKPGLALVCGPTDWNPHRPGHDGRLDVLRASTGKHSRGDRLPADFQTPWALAVSADGRRVAVAGVDRILVRGRQPRTEISAWPYPETARHLSLSRDGSRLYLSDGGHAVERYDVATGKRVAKRQLPLRAEEVEALVAAPSGSAVFVGGSSGQIYAMHPDSLAVLAASDWHTTRVDALAVTDDGSLLFSGGPEGCVKVWPVARLLEVR